MAGKDASDAVERAVAAFEAHPAFEASDAEHGFEVTTTPFDARARATPPESDDEEAGVAVTVELPTLRGAVVADEAVGDAVEEGWFDTLALRLGDAYDVAEVEPLDAAVIERAQPPIGSGDRSGEAVVARFTFRISDPTAVADAAKAIVDYAEGTYVQGIVPGYEYDDPVAGLLARAQHEGDDEGARRGGTPL